jgi:hypothetical protein
VARRVSDIILRIVGDPGNFRQILREAGQDVDAFGRKKAKATVDVDTAPVETALDRARREIDEFGRISEEAKLNLDISGAEARLETLKLRLKGLSAQDSTPSVDMQITGALNSIARVGARLDALQRKRTTVEINVDRDRGIGGAIGGAARAAASAAGAIGSTLGSAAGAVGKFAGTALSGIPVIGRLGMAMGALGASSAVAGAAMLVLAPILIGAVLSGVIMLTGIVIALGASLLAAAAGVGVLAVALAAAFGPVLLVAIAAAARLAKVLEAVKAAEEGTSTEAERVKTALKSQASAHDNLGEAQKRLKATAVDAYRAWRQAAEDVEDAVRGIQEAELNRDQAALNVDKAEAALKDLRKEAGLTGASLDGAFKKFTDIDFRPKDLMGEIRKSGLGGKGGASELEIQQGILDVRDARLSEKTAIDGVEDATTRLADARAKELEFTQRGIAAHEPYAAALASVAAAQTALADASKETNEARADQKKMLDDLTPREHRLATVLGNIKKSLTEAFRPATRAIFGGLLDALKDVDDFAKDAGVRSGLLAIGRSIGDVLRTLGRELRRKEVREGFTELAKGGARLVRVLGSDVFRSVFRILLRIAREGLPWLLDGARKVGDAFLGWARSLNRSKIEDFVRRVRRSFNAWKGVVMELWGVIKAFFGEAADSGDEVAGSIRRILRRFREWLDQNPDAIKQFFIDAKNFANDLLEAIDNVIAAIKIMTSLAKGAKGAFDFVVEPVRDVARGAADLTVRNTKQPGTGSVVETIREAQAGSRTAIALLLRWGFSKERLRGLRVPGYAQGGLVRQLLGRGGDTEPIMATAGEYVIRRSIAQAIGIPRLDALNAGKINLATAVAGAGARAGVHIEAINLPPAPGHDQLGDPRHQAVQLARELRRRGGAGFAGGGS